MPENLLLEPETAPQVAEGFDYIKALVHVDAQSGLGGRGHERIGSSVREYLATHCHQCGQRPNGGNARSTSRFLIAFEKRSACSRTRIPSPFGSPNEAWRESLTPIYSCRKSSDMERFKSAYSTNGERPTTWRIWPLALPADDGRTRQNRALRQPPDSYYAEESKPF